MNKNKAGIYVPIVIGAVLGILAALLWLDELTVLFSGITRVFIIDICIYISYIVVAVYLQIIVHELGHLIFGKLSGFKFVWFRIGSVTIVRENGKLTRKKYEVAGTGGQCLMEPRDQDEQSSFTLYNLGGIILNLVAAGICLYLFFICPVLSIKVFLIIFVVIGILFALMNGIPLRIQNIPNDGHNVLWLHKDKTSRHALWVQLKINALMVRGVRLRNIPEQWFDFEEDKLDNALVCAVAVYRCAYYTDMRDFEKSRELSEYLLEHASGMVGIHRLGLLAELMFEELFGQCHPERVDALYTPELQKYFKVMESQLATIRIKYAYELIYKNDELGAQILMEEFEDAAKKYPYPAEIEAERELLYMAKNKVRWL